MQGSRRWSKKNFARYLAVQEYWDESLCNTCLYSEDEADELVNGRPICKESGVCKHLCGGPAASVGLSCDPNLLLLASGLSRPLETLRKISLMATDAVGLPTLNALGWLDFEIDLDTDSFADCIGAWLVQWRENVAKRRNHGR